MAVERTENGEGIGASAAEPARTRRLFLVIALGLLIFLVVLLVVAWIARRPIAEHFIERELERRGVQASYSIERIGLRDQVLRNVRIGDPARPDLTARFAHLQLRFKMDGSFQVYRIVARGVRVRGELLKTGRVSWGQVDKLLPPPSGKPFRLPDVAVDVADTTLALRTPYGNLGFAFEGAGNLTGGFKGRLATSSAGLAFGACALERVRSSVRLAVVARRPQVEGPLTATRFACPRSRLAIEAPTLLVDSSFSEGFDRFDGQGRLAATSLRAGDNGLANMVARLGFKGTAEDASGAIDIAAQRARLAAVFADRTRITGRYRIWPAKGNLSLMADYDARSAALAAPLVAGLAGPFDSARGTPAEPVARAIAAAIRRTASGFDSTGSMVMVNLRGGGGVRISDAELRGPGGARIRVAGGDGVNYYWPSGRIRIDGQVAMGGGGLPRADIALNQPRSGGPMSGEARVQPYAAGGARLALAPVLFRAARDGSTAVRTVAILDGPFAGGRVTGLRLPIDGRIGGPGGGFAFGQGCIDARFTSLSAGALRLGAARIPLCPAGRAIIAKRGAGPVEIGAVTRSLRLGGRLGKSPFALTAASARFNGPDRFAAERLAARFGRPEAPVRVEAARLSGRFAGGGASGDLGDADVIIGRVPVALENAAGRWTFRGGRLAVNGSATAYDRAPEPRFAPLATNDLDFVLANDRIRTTASLRHPGSGTLVSNIAIDHRLSTGAGEALLDVPGIDFALGGLQPEDITRLTEGVIALVDGRVSGQGRIAWKGDGSVTSSGEFTTSDLDLAAAFGPVTGLSTTIRFTDLLNLETAPGQTLRVATINPGILVTNGELRYQILPGKLVRIERGEWPFMGGKLVLEETILNFGRPSPKRLTFTVIGLDAKVFVDTFGFTGIEATGIFDGALPMVFDDEGGRIVGGILESREGGGTLAYNGPVSRAKLGFFGEMAFDALRSLRFRHMVIRLDGDLAGEFATRLTIDQVGLGNATGTQRLVKSLVRRVPFKFNVTIKGPFRALIATAKSFRDPRGVIRDVLPVPIDQIPGVVTEVRRREESQQQSQTPVSQDIDISTTPPAEPSEERQ
jgi:translocation and assembly module TamB